MSRTKPKPYRYQTFEEWYRADLRRHRSRRAWSWPTQHTQLWGTEYLCTDLQRMSRQADGGLVPVTFETQRPPDWEGKPYNQKEAAHE